MTVIDAASLEEAQVTHDDLTHFSFAMEGMELILKLTQEGVAINGIYALVVNFLKACTLNVSPLLLPVFTLELLHELGLLPSLTRSCVSGRPLKVESDIVFSSRFHGFCTQDEDPSGETLLTHVADLLPSIHHPDFANLPAFDTASTRQLERIARLTLHLQLDTELKVPPVAARISPGSTPIWKASGRVS